MGSPSRPIPRQILGILDDDNDDNNHDDDDDTFLPGFSIFFSLSLYAGFLALQRQALVMFAADRCLPFPSTI